MTKKFICDTEDFIFYEGTKTIVMPVHLELPKQIVTEGFSFFVKNTFHITLVAIGKIIENNHIKIQDFENLITRDFCDFVKSNPIKLLKYINEYRFVVKEELRSIVVMCDVSNLDEFFKLLNKKYNLNLETPPTHATIYTLPEKLGIFLLDLNDLKTKTKIIKIPELEGKFQ